MFESFIYHIILLQKVFYPSTLYNMLEFGAFYNLVMTSNQF